MEKIRTEKADVSILDKGKNKVGLIRNAIIVVGKDGTSGVIRKDNRPVIKAASGWYYLSK